MSEYKFSVVLPVYNDQKNLNRILAELSTNSPDDNWEVIVVDDGSQESLQLAPNTPGHWKILRHETRRGAASARNTGVKHARGEVIVFLSVFLKIPENYISIISAFVNDHTFDVAQHLVCKDPGVIADQFQEFLTDQSGRLSVGDEVLPVKNTLFTASIIKKEIFSEVGGFDENMNHYGGHELDLAHRLDQKGYSTRIIIQDTPLGRVNLESHTSIQSRLREYGRIGLPALLEKHPELKKTILPYPALWALLKLFGLPQKIEQRIAKLVAQDQELPNRKYRLYLHLLARNAWDAR